MGLIFFPEDLQALRVQCTLGDELLQRRPLLE